MLAHRQKTKKTKAGVRKQKRKTWNFSCPAEHIINTKESLKVDVCGLKVSLCKFWFCNIFVRTLQEERIQTSLLSIKIDKYENNTLLSSFERCKPVLFLAVLGNYKKQYNLFEHGAKNLFKNKLNHSLVFVV